MHLTIDVVFTAGLFHGEEWPPSPARLFQALIAATHGGANRLLHTEIRDQALRWLEAQSPPSILAPSFSSSDRGRTALINYVPNNDDALEPDGHIRTAKNMAAYPVPAGSMVTYAWLLRAKESESLRDAEVVTAMAALVTYLGRTVDLVYARGQLLDPAQLPLESADRQWHHPRADADGRWLAPASGFFALCQRRFPKSVSQEPPDFTNSHQLDYSPPRRASAKSLAANSYPPIAIYELRRNGDDTRFRDFAPAALREPVGMTRHALVQLKSRLTRVHSADLVAQLVFGHASNGATVPTVGHHFAVAALPSLNADNTADGRIRRIAFIGFGATSPVALSLFHDAAHLLHTAPLIDGGKSFSPQRVGSLHRLTKIEAENQIELIIRPSRIWRTLTPVILPGFPRRKITSESLLINAIKQAGVSAENVSSVATFTGPLIPKTLDIGAYRLRDYLAATPRRHAEIIFKQPVSGPLLLGRGRYVGLGLFVPA